MHRLSAHQSLQVWDEGQDRGPIERALLLLGLAEPERTPHELAALPVGERDRRLLRFYQQQFGPDLAGVARCDRCSTSLDFEVRLQSLLDSLDPPSALVEPRPVGSWLVRVRPVDSRDLWALTDCATPEQGRRRLLARCVSATTAEGEPVASEALPDEVLPRLTELLETLDPAAEILLDLRCAACGHAWQELLDIVTFLWTLLDAEAQRLLREVGVLARCFGWREADILSMTPRRRASYLGMVGA